MKPQRLSGTHSEGLCIYIKMMKEIKLTQNQFALVDDEDFEHLNQFKWCAHKRGNTFYAERSVPINGKYKTKAMHKFIMCDNPFKSDVDHRDGNGLNNQRGNLRFCTDQQNQMNAKPRKNCSSNYKGVSLHKPTNKWRARITIEGKLIYFGLFNSEEDAARIYDDAAIKYYGEFARLNF